MTDEFERVPVSARIQTTLRDDFDEWVEGSEFSNRSNAIEGLIREAVEGDVATDGGTSSEPDEYLPTDRVLRAVYEAAVAATGDDHTLRDEEVPGLAQTINNARPDISPGADAVRRYLHRLQPRGYVRKAFRAHSVRSNDGTTKWHIKPRTAVPDEWKHHPENVRARREQREEARRSVILQTSEGDA